ncbi:MAG: RidA family protein [Pseudomonadota bacterium]|nr:RidA family protein [Pseudomonadota bacterium]
MSNTDLPQALHPKGWKPASGYSNGMVASGPMVFVGGQIGWNADQVFESSDFVEQSRQALRNVVDVIAEAGGGPETIVRLVWYVTDKREYLARLKEVGAAYRSVMGKHFPAMTLVEVSGLLEDAAKVEIEATAVLSGSGKSAASIAP